MYTKVYLYPKSNHIISIKSKRDGVDYNVPNRSFIQIHKIIPKSIPKGDPTSFIGYHHPPTHQLQVPIHIFHQNLHYTEIIKLSSHFLQQPQYLLLLNR